MRRYWPSRGKAKAQNRIKYEWDGTENGADKREEVTRDRF